MVIKDGPFNSFGHFLNKPIVPSYLVKILLIWMSKDNFESKSSPRYFQQLALSTGLFLTSVQE